MRRTSRTSLGVALAAALATVVSLPAAAAPAGGSLTSTSLAPVQDFLALLLHVLYLQLQMLHVLYLQPQMLHDRGR